MSNEANPGLLPSQEQMFEMIRDLQKKAKEDEEEKARKDQKIAALEGQFEDFNDYVKDNMVPIKEIVLGPKRMSQKDREYEVERVTRSYKRAADKKAVGFIADWRIDVRERQEAVVRLSKFREVFEDDSLGDFSWDKEETRKEILAFVDFIGQESEDARRKLLEQWDHYAIARDSKWGWSAVPHYKRPKTFEHGDDNQVPSHREKELTSEEKNEKLKKAERDARQSQTNAPGGRGKALGKKNSYGQNSSYRRKV